nr:hypothetical protein [uncultured Draconibacterium sp.]
MTERKILWETEGERIHSSDVKDLLFINESVKEFIDYQNKFFIIASKGIGKTILLKHKRYTLEKKHKSSNDSNVLFIPSVNPYLDFASDYGELSQNHICYLKNWLNTKILWQLSLQLSLIGYYVSNYKSEKTKEIIELLPEDFKNFIDKYNERNPCDVIEYLLRFSISEINKNIQEWKGDINKVYQRLLQSGIYIFIDRLDQALLRYEKEVWISFQVGLLEAAWDLMRANHHVKIFCSIRQEALFNYESPNKQSILGSITFLRYTKEELKLLLDTLSEYYEASNFSDFIGFSDFKHPLTHNLESVDEYLLRHTIYRPRDLVTVAQSLHPYKGQINIDIYRTEINTVSSQQIARNLFSENAIFLGGLQNVKQREKFLALIPRNILSNSEVLDICKSFNNQTNCNNSKCLDCQLCHAFSELYNLGLVGYVDNNDLQDNGSSKQKFKKPHDVYGVIRGILPVKMKAYILHPSLNDYLKYLRNKYYGEQFQIIPAITVGNDYEWGKKQSIAFEFYLLLDSIDNNDLREDLTDLIHLIPSGKKEESKTILKTITEKINRYGTIISNGEKIIEIGAKLIELM